MIDWHEVLTAVMNASPIAGGMIVIVGMFLRHMEVRDARDEEKHKTTMSHLQVITNDCHDRLDGITDKHIKALDRLSAEVRMLHR